MSRQRKSPAYLLHQATGQARVRINGKDIYLGPFGSPESKERYREVLQEARAMDAQEGRADMIEADEWLHSRR